MRKFLSGMGMGMVAGACMGLAAAGLVSDSDKRKLRRTAARAMQKAEDAASSLGLGHK